MESINSVLRFENYIINKIQYTKNENYQNKVENNEEAKKGIDVDLSIKPNIQVNGEKMIVNLSTYIFKNSIENNYPFELEIEITGFFTTQGDAVDRFKANAIAIMYPYVRAVVSTYTALANIPPLILPAINVNALLEQQNNK